MKTMLILKKMSFFTALLMTAFFPLGVISETSARDSECVILLHGLLRTASSLEKMESALEGKGYQVVNLGYDSRAEKIETLSESAIPRDIAACEKNGAVNKIHFVTHSMGGILVRDYLSRHTLNNLGRVVMLSPPNQGSEAVDQLKALPGFDWLNGPAGLQLGTGVNSLPKKLGPANFTVGIITGNLSINLFLSSLIPGKDDGKVSVESAKLEGMADFLELPHTHVFIMKSDDVIEQTIYFLSHGRFNKVPS